MKAFRLTQTWPAKNVSAGWVNKEGIQAIHGNSSKQYELASITKPLFSLAILIACEEGTLDLNQPAGPTGATVSNLLSHSSGLAMNSIPGSGEQIECEPNSKRIYSNQAFEVLGKELESASGMSASQYFHESVVEPLGLTGTRLHGSPARDCVSCVDDLLAIANELQSPKLISNQTLHKATSPHLPSLKGVLPGFGMQNQNVWGLGFEIKGNKSPHWTAKDNSPSTFGHFGQSGTFMWIDPLAEEACIVLTDSTFGPWAKEQWPIFSQAILDETP